MKLNKATMTIISFSVRFIVVALILFFVLRGAMFAYDFGYSIFMDEAAAEAASGRSVEVTLLEGSSARDIGKQLENLGVIRDANIFYIQALLSGDSKKLKGGKYTLNTSMPPSQIMQILTEGPKVENSN